MLLAIAFIIVIVLSSVRCHRPVMVSGVEPRTTGTPVQSIYTIIIVVINRSAPLSIFLLKILI